MKTLRPAISRLGRRRSLGEAGRWRGEGRVDSLLGRRHGVVISIWTASEPGRHLRRRLSSHLWHATHTAHAHPLSRIHQRSGTLRHVPIQQQLRRHLLHLGLDVVFLGLSSQHALGLIAMPLALTVLLVGVLHADVLVHEVLRVHVCDCVVAGLEVGVGDEAVALGEAGFVAGDLGRGDEGAEAREGFVEGLFVDEGVEVADEELGAYFNGLLLVC